MTSERAKVAIAALAVLDMRDLTAVHDHIADRLICAGMPMPPMTTAEDEIAAWLGAAPFDVVRAIAAISAAHLPANDKSALAAALLRHIKA